MLQFEDADGDASAHGIRVSNRYVYGDVVDMLLAEEQYTNDDGPLVGSLAASAATGTTLWPLADHLGSIRDVVDNSGTVRLHVDYDAYGKRVIEKHYDAAGTEISASHASAIDALFGYTGRDWDADVDLQYNRARWYEPSLGRWLSQAPISFAAGDANLYRYVGNKSTTHVDPSGLEETGLNRVEEWKGDRYGVPGTWWQEIRPDGYAGPLNFTPSSEDVGGLGGQLLRNRFKNVAYGAQVCEERGTQAATVGFFIATLFIPGPEDAILLAIGARYGLKVVGGVVSRNGVELAGKELDDAVRLIKETAKERAEADALKFTREMCENSKVIAKTGKIDKIDELLRLFGGKRSGWTKKKGWDGNGQEWHWYEHNGIGRKGIKKKGESDPF